MRYKVPIFSLLASLLSVMGCVAQPPAPPPPSPAPGPSALTPPPPPPGGRGGPAGPGTRGSRTTISGVVRGFNYGPGGADGLILDQGTVIHFPPEYSSQVSAAAPIGSAVAAAGWSHIGPAGDTLFDADTITNQRSRASIAMAAAPSPPPPGPPPPPPPAPSRGLYPSAVGPLIELTGVVRSLNYDVGGQVNGFVLSDKTPVYFPPEFADQITRSVAVGGHVKVTGSLRAGPTGNRLMDAAVITNQQTGISVNIPDPVFPPVR